MEVMDLFEGLKGPEQMEAANNSGQEQDAPDSGHHTSVQTSSSVASCANTVTVQGLLLISPYQDVHNLVVV